MNVADIESLTSKLWTDATKNVVGMADTPPPGARAIMRMVDGLIARRLLEFHERSRKSKPSKPGNLKLFE